MRKIFSLLVVLLAPGAFAAGSSEYIHEFTPDTTNKASLQRGARLFVNYCMSCHSAGYHRYSHLARDLHLSERQVQENLIFTTDENGAPTKPGALMVVPMTDRYAKEAFGTVPPNLSLASRVRGASWLYSYLKGFYLDESRELIGVNNTVFPDVGMPHVLWDLQGFQVPVYKTEKRGGAEIRKIERLEIARPRRTERRGVRRHGGRSGEFPRVPGGAGAAGKTAPGDLGSVVHAGVHDRRVLSEKRVLERRSLEPRPGSQVFDSPPVDV